MAEKKFLRRTGNGESVSMRPRTHDTIVIDPSAGGATALKESGLAPNRLDLEITESVFIDDSAATLRILEELRSNNIGISLDDFGTGFASLSYLNDFPFSKIKIDRKFSQNVDDSPRTSAIIKGIGQITRELRMERVRSIFSGVMTYFSRVSCGET